MTMSVAVVGFACLCHGFLQKSIGGGHVGRGFVQKLRQIPRAFGFRRCGPFSELGFVITVVLDPVWKKHTQFFKRCDLIHAMPLLTSLTRLPGSAESRCR